MTKLLALSLLLSSSFALADTIRCLGKNVEVEITKSDSRFSRWVKLNGFLRSVKLEDSSASFSLTVLENNGESKEAMIITPQLPELEGRRLYVELHPTNPKTKGLYYKVTGPDNRPEAADRRSITKLVCTHL